MKSYRRENQDENKALNLQAILYICLGFFSISDPVGNKEAIESNPFHTQPEIIKYQSFLYQFGLKHKKEYFFLDNFD